MWKMILDSVLSNILDIVLTVVSLIVTYYIVPSIKNDLIPWLKEKRIYNIVKNFVQAVEKMAETGVVPKIDKKAKVVELLQCKGIVVDDTIDAFIESCVKELDIMASAVYTEIITDEVEIETEEQ